MTLTQARMAQRPSGFTLPEVMVALVILTTGILGTAELFVEGLRLNRMAIYRTFAINLAADMAERLRANQGSLASYAGKGRMETSSCSQLTDGRSCRETDLALSDWHAWQRAVNRSLPAGAAASIGVSAVKPTLSRVDIHIQWPATDSSESVTYTLTTYL